MCISNVTKIKNIQNIQVMANQNKTDIGLIGLAVMGENLALNMESKGRHVSVYNRTVPGVEEGEQRLYVLPDSGRSCKNYDEASFPA